MPPSIVRMDFYGIAKNSGFFYGVVQSLSAVHLEYMLSHCAMSRLCQLFIWHTYHHVTPCLGHVSDGFWCVFFRDSLLYSAVNSGTSFLAGFVIFPVLGFMAYEQGLSIGEVAESGNTPYTGTYK